LPKGWRVRPNCLRYISDLPACGRHRRSPASAALGRRLGRVDRPTGVVALDEAIGVGVDRFGHADFSSGVPDFDLAPWACRVEGQRDGLPDEHCIDFVEAAAQTHGAVAGDLALLFEVKERGEVEPRLGQAYFVADLRTAVERRLAYALVRSVVVLALDPSQL